MEIPLRTTLRERSSGRVKVWNSVTFATRELWISRNWDGLDVCKSIWLLEDFSESEVISPKFLGLQPWGR